MYPAIIIEAGGTATHGVALNGMTAGHQNFQNIQDLQSIPNKRTIVVIAVVVVLVKPWCGVTDRKGVVVVKWSGGKGASQSEAWQGYCKGALVMSAGGAVVAVV